MARSSGLLVLSVVLVVAFHRSARAQSPSSAPSTAPGSSIVMAPAPLTDAPLAPGPATSTDCMTTLMDNLSSCLSYVEAGSNMTRPEKGCCQGFAVVVNTQPMCLCSLISSSDVYGIQLDHTKSLMLPTVCGVQTLPVSLCSVIGAPASAPDGSNSAAPVGPTTLPAAAASPAALPPTGNGANPRFGSSVLALLAGLSFAPVIMI